MTTVTVAPGSADDLPQVMTVMNAAFEPRFGEAWTSAQCLALLALPGSQLLVASDTALVGFALARTIAQECELMMIGVMPRLQRGGIGGLLLNHVISNARLHKAEAIFLEVRRGNPAIDFYGAYDFKHVGTRTRYYRGVSGEQFDAETHCLNLI